jgi:cellulose synthase/poly-beta-1,6-N-acetylglucosamine synthase-like glycosyltransferase
MDSLFLPNVSVIVPIYNGEADLPELLTCLWAQDYPRDRVEYLIVDNNSDDRTVDLLKSAVQTAQSQGITLRPLSEPHIQSSYAARNVGIQAATSAILAFTDADCRPQPHWLTHLVQPFADEDIGLVAGEIQALPGQTLLEHHAERQETLSQKHTIAHPFCAYGQTANLAVRLDALQQVGLFRPYLTTGGDADLCWRILRQTPWQLRFAEAATVCHRHRSTLSELKSQWRRYGRSNRYLHDLHGVDLMREPSLQEYIYRLTRWVAKELPLSTVKLIRGKVGIVDLIGTPIGLVCAQARAQGQRQATLSEQAHHIEWLSR